jgi:hypothetical protein
MVVVRGQKNSETRWRVHGCVPGAMQASVREGRTCEAV